MLDRVTFRETPESPDIEGALYLSRTTQLWLYFRNGTVHVYSEVDTATWEAFQSAPSKGEFVLGLRAHETLVVKKKN